MFEPDIGPNSGPARGEFDPDNNYWAAGRGGMLLEFKTPEKRVHEYRPPTPCASLYRTHADRNGEIWTGEMHAGRFVRFNPKTVQFAEYVLPELYGIDRQSWIDNSTDRVTICTSITGASSCASSRWSETWQRYDASRIARMSQQRSRAEGVLLLAPVPAALFELFMNLKSQ